MLALLAGCIIILTVASPEALHSWIEMLTRCLVAAAAVFSADFIVGNWRQEKPKKVNWIGAVAISAGLAIPFLWSYLFVPDEPSWFPWLLPSYAVSFVTCLILRFGSRLFDRRLQLQ